MRRISATISAATFFLLAIVGWLSGVDTFHVALRAAGGAVVMLVVSLVAGRVVMNIVAEVVAEQAAAKPTQAKNPSAEAPEQEPAGESGNAS